MDQEKAREKETGADRREAYRRASGRVKAKLGFFIHLAVFLTVNALLVLIDLNTSPGKVWFQWPLMGWGIGVFFHFLGVFLFSTGSAWMDGMIRKEMEKESRRNS